MAIEKSGWLAASSVHFLLLNESLIMTAALKLDAGAVESQFNKLIEKGMEDVKELEMGVMTEADPVDLDLLCNFKDFVYLCIDVKKKNAQQQQQQQPLLQPQPQNQQEQAQQQLELQPLPAQQQQQQNEIPQKRVRKQQ